MILLSDALPGDEDGFAESFADTSETCIFFDRAIDGVPSCTALEYMAQTIAIAVGRERRRQGLPPAIGFVLGSRRLEVSVDRFARGARYAVSARCTYSDGEFAAFDCSIRDATGVAVASGTLTAFQPHDGRSVEMLA